MMKQNKSDYIFHVVKREEANSAGEKENEKSLLEERS